MVEAQRSGGAGGGRGALGLPLAGDCRAASALAGGGGRGG